LSKIDLFLSESVIDTVIMEPSLRILSRKDRVDFVRFREVFRVLLLSFIKVAFMSRGVSTDSQSTTLKGYY